MKLKTFILELFIMLTIFIATLLIVFWISPAKNIFSPHFEINKHDIWFIFGWHILIIPPFLMLTVVVYLAKEAAYRYKRNFQNIILICANFISIVFISRILIFADFLREEGGTVYPPLSALPKAHESLENDSAVIHICNIAFILFIVFMVILVVSAIFTGKNWKTDTHETIVQ